MKISNVKVKGCPMCGQNMENITAAFARLCEECGYEEPYTKREVEKVLFNSRAARAAGHKTAAQNGGAK